MSGCGSPPSGQGPEAREDVLSSSERSHLFFTNFFEAFFSGDLTNSMASVVSGNVSTPNGLHRPFRPILVKAILNGLDSFNPKRASQATSTMKPFILSLSCTQTFQPRTGFTDYFDDEDCEEQSQDNGFQTQTGFPSHLARIYSQCRRERVYVSNPDGLHWPFCRRWHRRTARP